MKKPFNKSHITILQFVFKRKLCFDKAVIWLSFANIPRMLRDNVLLVPFECQRFNGTTKADAIHVVYILVLSVHFGVDQITYFLWKESHEIIYFYKWKVKNTIKILLQICGRNMAY